MAAGMKLIRRLGIEDKIVLINSVLRKELPNYIKAADCVVVPSLTEGFGFCAAEACAMGKPVVAFIMPSVFEMGIPHDCPVVNANPSNLEEKLIGLLTSSELRNKIGKASRQYVERVHDADKLAAGLIEVYKSYGA